MASSVLTITALSLDRYIAIRHPVKSKTISTTTNVKLILLAIWILSCAIMLPLLFVKTLTVQPVQQGILDLVTIPYCHESWPNPTSRQIYDATLIVIIYVIPGCLVISFYSATGRHLMSTNENLSRSNSETSHYMRVMAGRRRVAKMLLVVAVLFALSWLPYNIIVLYTDFNAHNDTPLSALSFALLLGHSHSAQNPVIYCIMNSAFKKGMLTLLRCRWSAQLAPSSSFVVSCLDLPDQSLHKKSCSERRGRKNHCVLLLDHTQSATFLPPNNPEIASLLVRNIAFFQIDTRHPLLGHGQLSASVLSLPEARFNRICSKL